MTTAMLPSGFRIGEYEVEGVLGQGGMGTVYSARHPLIGKKAAIKVLSRALCSDPDVVARFVDEAKAVNHIGHPNIVDIFSIGEIDDGRWYFVMEWLEGLSLSEYVEHDGVPPISDTLAILDQIVDAVQAAHDKHIVHRDLKADNVMIVDRGRRRPLVKLLDFGIAKLANPEEDAFAGRTKTGLVMGTPGYMSPEQARGQGVDFRTDLYALGCLAFEMLTGRLPFVADNAMDVVIMHMQSAVPRARGFSAAIPDALDDLVFELMAKSAADRPALAEVRFRLGRIAGKLGNTSRFASAEFARIASSKSGSSVGGELSGLVTGDEATLASDETRDATEDTLASEETKAARGDSWGASDTQGGWTQTAAVGLKPRRMAPWVIVVGAVAAAVVGGGVLLAGSSDETGPTQASLPATAKAEAPQPAVAPAPNTAPAVPTANTASVRVVVNVSARIVVDGSLVGEGLDAWASEEIGAGFHLIEVNAEGYLPDSRKFTVVAGGAKDITFELTRVKAANQRRKARPPKRGERKSSSTEKTAQKAEAKPRREPKPNPERKPEPKRNSGDTSYTLDPFAR